MKCLICGCTQTSACIHPDAGPCAWHSDNLCDHCTDPQIYSETHHPKKNLKNIKLISATFRYALAKVNVPISASRAGDSFLIRGKLLNTEQSETFSGLIKAWFPKSELLLPNCYKVNLSGLKSFLDEKTF